MKLADAYPKDFWGRLARDRAHREYCTTARYWTCRECNSLNKPDWEWCAGCGEDKP